VDIFAMVLGEGVKALGGNVQRGSAAFCYRVYRRVHPKAKTWDNLTVAEQQAWAVALWDEGEVAAQKARR